jgi:outer membrane protein OmpA-like peptidoglycan-associated protein
MHKRLLICLAACLLAACAGRPSVTPVEEEPAPAAETRAEAKRPPAPSAVAVAPPLAAENIFFLAGSIEIEAAERNKLRPYAERLKADPRLVLILVGHTDDQGSRSYKLAIAQGRVDAVFAALRRLGVPARQMQRYPVGREKMVAGCNTAECRKTMRRVELVYRP